MAAWYTAIFDRLANGDFLVEREAAPAYVDGREVAQGGLSFQTGRSILVPATGAQLKTLPEGYDVTRTAQLTTRVALQVEPRPDVVVVAAATPGLEHMAGRWRCYQVQTHFCHGANHTVAYLAREP